ncbi:MAG: BMP family ABC transporter substrate-binding protein [Deltaproteobacteria bacterium]|nr:BMP family ABC transporter substrate-binding protein [Deltaproteobacteria bacterium]
MRLSLVIALVACVALLPACKRKEEPKPVATATTIHKSAPSAPAPIPAAASKTIPQPEAGRFNVAFVYVGPVGDGGWTWAHDQGRRFLEEKGAAHTAFVESVSEGAEAEQVIRSLARKGFDLVIGTSFGYMDAMEAAAREFPKTRFVHVSGFKSTGENYGSLFGAMESMKYLSGMLAGARAKADGQTKLGYIAPFPIPEVVRLANAVMLGAQRTCPECTLEIRWINSWFDPSREREAAESLFKSGAWVVVTGADTPGPVTAAKDAGRWAVGYDSSNACSFAPERCLTTSYWVWGPVYLKLVEQMKAGTWKATHEYLEVDSGIVGLYGFMEGQSPPPGVPAEVVPQVKEVLGRMRSGAFTRFDVFAGPLEDNEGRQLLKAGEKPEHADLEGLPGCKVCMSWLAKGVVGQLPARK